MRIGNYDVHAIDAGRFALDGGAMFGVVPRPLWQKRAPPDGRNRIDMSTRCLLIVGNGRHILIDTGNGTKFDQKLTDIYRMEVTSTTLDDALAVHHLKRDDITDVFLTHLHFDHAGGATRLVGDAVVPAFPAAKYHLQRDHWQAALNPTVRDRASFFPNDFLPLWDHSVLELIDGEGELFPGISVRVFHGHTCALQCPVIKGDGVSLLFCADLIPMVPHVQLSWIMGYDLRPLVTLEEKRKVLQTAANEGWILALEHDPRIDGVTVRQGSKGVEVHSEVRLE